MLNVFIYTNENTPSVFYRATVPLEYLQAGGEIKLVNDPRKADVIWVVRYSFPFNEFPGKRVVYTLDDDLWAISPQHKHYDDIQGVLPNVRQWVERADVVVTSTRGVGERVYGMFGKDVVVVENSIPDQWMPQEIPPFRKFKVVMAVGFYGHDEDIKETNLDLELPKISRAYTPQIFGSSMLSLGPTLEYNTSIEKFRQTLSSFSGSMGLIPLADSEFNQGKSTIKFIEYVASGILPVFSPVGEYLALGKRFPRLVCDGSWEESMNKVRNWSREMTGVHEYVRDHYLISKKINGWRRALAG